MNFFVVFFSAYMLMFLITVLGFVAFAVDVNSPYGRAQITATLILTSVNFRWIITQRLPSVPYLTSIDKYAIGNLFFLVVFLVWHSVVPSDFLENISIPRKDIDTYILMAFGFIYATYNSFYAIWFFRMKKLILRKKLAEEEKAKEE